MSIRLCGCLGVLTGSAVFVAGIYWLAYLICPCGYYASIGG